MAQPENYTITLNFLPLVPAVFTFEIFRRDYQDEASDGQPVDKFRAEIRTPDADGKDSWVRFDAEDGYNLCRIDASRNVNAALRYLNAILLQSKVKVSAHQRDSFRRYLAVVIGEHPEGEEVMLVEPYFLREERQFGYLLDFRFFVKRDIPYTRRIQQLSLSLDKDFQSNKNNYRDRFSKVSDFVTKYVASGMIAAPTGIAISHEFAQLRGHTLQTKQYQFASSQVAASQFQGVKRFGPLESAPPPSKFVFVYEAKHADAARQLWRALAGKVQSVNFDGMERLFRVPFANNAIEGFEVPTLDVASIIPHFSGVENEQKTPMVILVVSDDADNYYELKHAFLTQGIAVQFVTVGLLSNPTTFKWAVANIGLQMFAKLGGKPWKVIPRHAECLIVGIGQAHEREIDSGKITKFFAYSVLTDSSGIFQDVIALAQADAEAEYSATLLARLRELLRTHAGSFKKIVVHAPFRIKRRELTVLQKAIEETAQDMGEQAPEFIVIRVNTETRLFGYWTGTNSLVPYESTFIQIGRDDFLLWFEGLQYQNPTVRQRVSGPSHIDFWYTSHRLSDGEKLNYLQDVLNLSGANWRGFNAKSSPVSIYYCELVADFVREFRVRGLGDIGVENLKPWFL